MVIKRCSRIRFAVACLQAALVLCLQFAPLVQANPTGEQVAAGAASFNRNGSTLTIRTSDRVIINWQDFSIGNGELTKFIQPSAQSAALNRVVSGNPSSILGTLQANGQIFLINPNGILVGGGAVIDTGGFIASTLDVNDQQFLQGGNLDFTGSSTAKIENQGKINAIGGDIVLIARHVENKGELNAPDGAVALAAGTEVLLAQSGQEKVFVKPAAGNASGTGIDNSGAIQAARAELKATGNLYALAINNSGIVRASGAVTKDGRVYLTANGGSIHHSGTISAKNGQKGGAVQVLAKSIAMTGQAVVDASGAAGGGQINIGGSRQGLGPLPNADVLWIGPDTTISADALSAGDGGEVILFASDTAAIHGNLSALGAGGGIGGFIETSGKEYLEVLNTPLVGQGGTWLIDPRNLRIRAGGGSTGVTFSGVPAAPIATSTADSADMGVNIINAALNSGANVIVQTGGTGLQAGDLTVDAGVNIVKSSANAASLTMNAHNHLSVNGISSSNNTLTITLNADSDNSGAGAVTINGAIVSNGGNFAANGAGVTLAAGSSVNAGAGTIALDGKAGALAIGGGLTASQISLNGAGMSQTGGAITATGLAVTGGAGIFNLQQVGNDIATLAASVGGNFSYRDANSYQVGTVGALSGVQASSGTVSLLAPGILTINDTPVAGADVQGTTTVDLIANALVINGTVSSGTTATLRQFTPGRAIDLGGADTLTSLGITAAELNQVTAGVIRVGSIQSGDLTVTAPIAPTGTTRLTLRTGAAVIDGNAVGTDITVANLAILSSTGIGALDALDTAASFLAFNNTTSGDVRISNTGALTITSLDGITTSSNAGGTTTISAASPLTFGVDTTSAGTLTATAGESGAANDDLTVNAGVTVRSTGGNTVLRAGDSVVLAAGSTARSDAGDVTLISGLLDSDGIGNIQLAGSITAFADAALQSIGGATQTGGTVTADGLLLSGTGNFTLTQVGNDVSMIAGAVDGAVNYTDSDLLQVGSVNGVDGLQATGAVNLAATGLTVNNLGVFGGDVRGAVVNLAADNMTLDGTLVGTTVALHPLTAGQLIDLGGADAAGTLGLTAAEINQVTAVRLIIGDAQSGDITVSAAIAPTGTSTVSLVTAGAVIDGNVAGSDLTVSDLAIFAATGIGSSDALDTAVSNLAFVNTTSGDVQISNTGALTIASVGGIAVSSNNGGATVISTASPLTFAADVISAGSLVASAGESAGAGDDLTVNAGVTLRSIAGDILLSAGDNVLVGVGSLVQSDGGNATLIAGDNLTNDGTVQAGSDITLVVDNDFPTAPDFGAGTLVSNGALVRGGRLLVYAVQPSQVLNPASLVPQSQWQFSTYFGDAIPAVGDVLAFKVALPSPPSGPGAGVVSSLLAMFDDNDDRYHRLPLTPPGDENYGIYYDSSSLNAAPPNLGGQGTDAGLDAAPPHGIAGATLPRKKRNLTTGSSFEAFAHEAPPAL